MNHLSRTHRILLITSLAAGLLFGCSDDSDGEDASGCETPQTWCQDADGDGHGDASVTTEACTAPSGYVSACDDCDDSEAAAYPGQSESCDGVDNNCDGETDEGFGLGDVCSVGVGACRQEGVLSCGASGQASCDAVEGSPSEEVCDSIDNDCNGTVDDAAEACACEDGEEVACGSDVGACMPGTQTCTNGAFGACEGSTEATEEVCNGIDDDCNGEVDDLADPGCGCVGGEVVPCDPPPEVFALQVEVRAPGGGAQASFMQPVSRDMFDGRHINNDNAVEVESIGRLWTTGGYMYTGLRTEPTFVKYEVGEDLSLTELDTVNFMSTGASRIDIGQVWISPTKAYFLWGGTLMGVVWNPSTMVIEDTIDLSGAELDGYEGLMLLQGVFLFEHAVHEDRAFVSTLYSSGSDGIYYPGMNVVVFDTENDEVLKVISDDRCYGASTMVKDDNGDIYVSSYGYAGRIFQAEGYDYKPTCILRINAGEDEFDPDFFVSFPDLMGGKESTRWYPVNGRYSYTIAIDRADLEASEQPFNTEGEIWMVDIVERTAKKVEGLPNSSAFYSLGYPDSDDSIVLGALETPGELDRSVVYRLVPEEESVTPILEIDGLFRGFYPIR